VGWGIHDNNKVCGGFVQPQDYQLLRVKLRGSIYCFDTLSQNCEKLPVASPRLSVRPHGTTLLPLDGFALNLMFEYFSKKTVVKIQLSLQICQE